MMHKTIQLGHKMQTKFDIYYFLFRVIFICGESNLQFLWFILLCVVIGLVIRIAPLFEPIRSKTKTNN